MAQHFTPARSAALLAGAALVASAACAPRTVGTTSGGTMSAGDATGMRARSVDQMLAAWPAKQRETAMTLVSKYGQPDVTSDRLLVWYNKGPYVKTALTREAVPHNFPMPHMDYLAQTVKHSVPLDKLDELAMYDGSVWYHRTRGELTAQCDMEELNNLALNLAHDVATGRRTVEDARMFYGKTAIPFKQGDRSNPYVTGIMFRTEPNAAQPDTALKMSGTP